MEHKLDKKNHISKYFKVIFVIALSLIAGAFVAGDDIIAGPTSSFFIGTENSWPEENDKVHNDTRNMFTTEHNWDGTHGNITAESLNASYVTVDSSQTTIHMVHAIGNELTTGTFKISTNNGEFAATKGLLWVVVENSSATGDGFEIEYRGQSSPLTINKWNESFIIGKHQNTEVFEMYSFDGVGINTTGGVSVNEERLVRTSSYVVCKDGENYPTSQCDVICTDGECSEEFNNNSAGDHIYIRGGAFDYTSSINLSDGTTLECSPDTLLNFEATSGVGITNADHANGNSRITIKNCAGNGRSELKSDSNEDSFIMVRGVDNLEISGMNISNSRADGIDLRDASGKLSQGEIFKNTIESAGRNGISLEGARNTDVFRNTISNVTRGIDIEGGADQRFIDVYKNDVSHFSSVGIQIDKPTGEYNYSVMTIDDNTVYEPKLGGSTIYGISVIKNSNGLIDDVTVKDNKLYSINGGTTVTAIYILGGTNMHVEDNKLSYIDALTTTKGIHIQSDHATVEGNQLYNITDDGIYVGSDYNILKGNNIRNVDGKGIRLSGSIDGEISGNNVQGISSNAIRLESQSDGNTIKNNVAHDNVDVQVIFLTTGSDGGEIFSNDIQGTQLTGIPTTTYADAFTYGATSPTCATSGVFEEKTIINGSSEFDMCRCTGGTWYCTDLN